MSFTMEDFNRQYVKEHFRKLTAEERREVLQSLPPEERGEVVRSLPPEAQEEVLQSLPPEKRLAGLSAAQIRRYLDQLTAGRPSGPRKPRRKK
jgi:Mg/Co/Ni transporter MgtE